MEFNCDVAVIGGAFSGASTALLLRRQNPACKVVIIEKAEEFDRKVGESTTEVSSCFLTRVLGLSTYLAHHQLPKQGLRMWFARTETEPFADCVEIGARYNSRLSGFQVDRSTLDEHVLQLATEAGCELWRPARLMDLELGGAGHNVLTVRCGEETRTLRARWIVDASGRAAVIARKLGILRPVPEHPVNALWARFEGVKDWDGAELRQRFPGWADATRTEPRLGDESSHGPGLVVLDHSPERRRQPASGSFTTPASFNHPPELRSARSLSRIFKHIPLDASYSAGRSRCRAISVRIRRCRMSARKSLAMAGCWLATPRASSIRFTVRGWISARSPRKRLRCLWRGLWRVKRSKRSSRVTTRVLPFAIRRGSTGSIATNTFTWATPN